MKSKKSPSEKNMLLWSMEYIIQNPTITTDLIPNDLLRFWAIPDFNYKSRFQPNELQVLVFLYTLRHLHPDGKDTESLIETVYFCQLFFSFQVVISTTLICRKNRLRTEPFPIFKLDEYKLPGIQEKEELLNTYEMITGRKVFRKTDHGSNEADTF